MNHEMAYKKFQQLLNTKIAELGALTKDTKLSLAKRDIASEQLIFLKGVQETLAYEKFKQLLDAKIVELGVLTKNTELPLAKRDLAIEQHAFLKVVQETLTEEAYKNSKFNSKIQAKNQDLSEKDGRNNTLLFSGSGESRKKLATPGSKPIVPPRNPG